jgi:hypothetical protein
LKIQPGDIELFGLLCSRLELAWDFTSNANAGFKPVQQSKKSILL